MIKIKIFFYLFFFLLLSNNSYSKNNVYYIDIDYVLTNTIIGKSLLANLKEEEKLIINKIKDNDEKFKTDEQKILAKKNLISNEELSREMQSLRDKFKEYKKNKDIEIEDFKKKNKKNIKKKNI